MGLGGLEIISADICRKMYLRATREELSLGIVNGRRPELTIEEARSELSGAISRITSAFFRDKYGPLLGVVSEPAVNEFLKGFELNLLRAKGDMTIVLEELFDRITPNSKKRKKKKSC